MTLATILVLAFTMEPSTAVGERPWIAEALVWGAKQKQVDLPFAKGARDVWYSTPYLRVAKAGREAAREGRALDAGSIAPELAAPELHVFATMKPFGTGGHVIGMMPATHVTLIAAGHPLEPARMETRAVPMSVGDLGGDMRRFEGRELSAVFPLSEPIPAEVQVVVQYSGGGDGEPKRIERTYKLELRKTKW